MFPRSQVEAGRGPGRAVMKLALQFPGTALRKRRNELLQQSDWTQLPDVPIETREQWAAYRQALRDVTQQPGFPNDVEWPEPPQ